MGVLSSSKLIVAGELLSRLNAEPRKLVLGKSRLEREKAPSAAVRERQDANPLLSFEVPGTGTPHKRQIK